jgi:hypothetical protein
LRRGDEAAAERRGRTNAAAAWGRARQRGRGVGGGGEQGGVTGERGSEEDEVGRESGRRGLSGFCAGCFHKTYAAIGISDRREHKNKMNIFRICEDFLKLMSRTFSSKN